LYSLERSAIILPFPSKEVSMKPHNTYKFLVISLFASLFLLLMDCSILNPPLAGTYSGTFDYYGQTLPSRHIYGTVSVTITDNMDTIPSIQIDCQGSDSFQLNLSNVKPSEYGDGWFTIFNIPIPGYSSIPNFEPPLTINCDWNIVGWANRAKKAKCGIALVSADDICAYGGSASLEGFELIKQ